MADRARLLLVDDDAKVRACLASRLGGEFNVAAVASLADAVSALRLESYAVVLVIQRSPGLAASELRIRARRYARFTQWIWAAGYPSWETLAEALAPTAWGCDPGQPWDDERLLTLLREATHAYRVRTERAAARRRAEQALRESQRACRMLVDYAPDAILVADASAERYTEANAAASDLLGYTREELLRLRPSDLVPEDERGRVPLVRSLQPGEAVRARRRLRRKDGSVVETEATGRRLPDGRFQFVYRDAPSLVANDSTGPSRVGKTGRADAA